jgi:GH25 family lysozyme M1 (1,4-beta-N-acetylmuramidase)
VLNWLRSLFQRLSGTPGTAAKTTAPAKSATAAAAATVPAATTDAAPPAPSMAFTGTGPTAAEQAAEADPAPDSAPAATTGPRGVDVSSFQGIPADWKASAGSIAFAGVKMTELESNGTRYVNPDAGDDWRFLKQNGHGRIAYLYGHPNVNAADTVSFFAGEVHKLGLDDADAIALDLEETDGLGPAAVASWAVRVQEGLFHALGRMPLLYTFLSFAEEGNCAGLGRYPLWIADPSSAAGHPRVPGPWQNWAIHQYSITGPIDRDIGHYANKTAMFKALGKSEGPEMRNIGGSITGALATARWPDGVTVVAGLGTDGFVQIVRWHDNNWGVWRNVSKAKAKGAPGLVAFGGQEGHLYYTEESGAVIELTTNNSGESWE